MSAADSVPEDGLFGRFEILTAQRQLRVDGQAVALGSRAFDLLAALAARRDRVVPKDELIGLVWPGLVVEDNNLQVQISALRKVLGTQAIATVPGRGYQFTVAAAAAGAVQATRAPERSVGAAPQPARLLVADDNKVNRLLLCRSLELMGHEVASADNGRAALAKLRGERFDLLLLDLEMPELDGFALLEQRAADAALHGVPVIVTSSLEGVAQVARCIELGADDYLHKPVNPVLLKARVDSSLERKRLRDRQAELLARLAPDLPGTAQGADAALPDARRTTATLLCACVSQVDTLPPHDTLELLSRWTTLMFDAVEEQGGLVSQIGGDSLVAAFGAHRPATGDAGAPWAALQAAREMVELVALFNAERSASGSAALMLSVGIASGEVVAGHAGTPRRSAYVCVGAAVQRAAQLEALATQRGGGVLVDAATQQALSGDAAAHVLAPVALPGGSTLMQAYALGPD